MVDLVRGGGLGLSCGLCGRISTTTTTPKKTTTTTTTTAIRQLPVILRLRRRRAWRRHGVDDDRNPKVKHDGPRACEKTKSDGGTPGGTGTGTDLKNAGGSSSFSRRHRCKFFRNADKSVDGDLGTAVCFACIDARRMTAAAQNIEERARSDVAILARCGPPFLPPPPLSPSELLFVMLANAFQKSNFPSVNFLMLGIPDLFTSRQHPV